MKAIFIIFAFLLLGCFARGQGFVYDQQATNGGDSVAYIIPENQPLGQSFTPTLSSVTFVTFWFFDAVDTSGGTVYVNLRSTSITGPILGSSTPVFIYITPAYADVFQTFYFPTAISVTPGVQYFFQPIDQSGDTIGAINSEGTYRGGNQIIGGVVRPNYDYWFQEGIVAAPEPSPSLLLLVGSGILFYARRRK
jgi:hypothetical protein